MDEHGRTLAREAMEETVGEIFGPEMLNVPDARGAAKAGPSTDDPERLSELISGLEDDEWEVCWTGTSRPSPFLLPSESKGALREALKTAAGTSADAAFKVASEAGGWAGRENETTDKQRHDAEALAIMLKAVFGENPPKAGKGKTTMQLLRDAMNEGKQVNLDRRETMGLLERARKAGTLGSE